MTRYEWEQKRRVEWAKGLAEEIAQYAENEYDEALTDWGIARRRLFHLGLEMIDASIDETLDARECIRVYRALLDKAVYYQNKEAEAKDSVKPKPDNGSLRGYSYSELMAILEAMESMEIRFDILTSERFKEKEDAEYEKNPDVV